MFAIDLNDVASCAYTAGGADGDRRRLRAEQKTDKWLALIALRFSYLNEQYLRKVPVKVSAFFRAIFKMYLLKVSCKHSEIQTSPPGRYRLVDAGRLVCGGEQGL